MNNDLEDHLISNIDEHIGENTPTHEPVRFTGRRTQEPILKKSERDNAAARPLCYFIANHGNCTRTNPEHHNEFSHDEHNYNRNIASRSESRKEYPVANGGHAGPARPPTKLGISVMQIGQLLISECPGMIEKLVKNAGIAFLTKDGYLVMVRERDSKKLNFPCGKKDRGESAIQTALREMSEELGWNPLDGQRDVSHMLTVVRNHTSSQSVIYVLSHPQPTTWFKANFQINEECYAIAFMTIPEFREIVNDHRCEIFRYPDSMKNIQRHIDAFFSKQ